MSNDCTGTWKRHPVCLVSLILILLLGLPACGEQIEPTATAEPEPKKKTPGPDETGLPFETVFHYDIRLSGETDRDLEYYEKREPALFVVTRHEDMESVESWLPEGPLLAIDYAQYLVVAVFQGYSGYTIPFAEGELAFVTIEHVTSKDGVVNIYASVPTKTSEEQLCAVQSPFHVVKVNKDGLPTGQSIVFRLIVNGDVLARQRERLP